MENSDQEYQDQNSHVGSAAHIIQKGVRLKWPKYDQFFKRVKFLTVLQKSARRADEKWPLTIKEAMEHFASRPNSTDEPVIAQLAPFLLAEDPSLFNPDQVNQPSEFEKAHMLTGMAKVISILIPSMILFSALESTT